MEKMYSMTFEMKITLITIRWIFIYQSYCAKIVRFGFIA